MFNLTTLDTLIAVVVVLLVLSLVVQSIQAALKKLFKIKSRQIEESLIDLFEHVLNVNESAGSSNNSGSPATNKPVKKPRLPTLRQIPGVKNRSDSTSHNVTSLFNAVTTEFNKIGRVSASGKIMLDSISKEDLMKILQKVGAKILQPGFEDELENICTRFGILKEALEKVKIEKLSGDASAKFAKVLEALTPLLNDIQCLFVKEGTTLKVKSNLILSDILNLREMKIGEVLDSLGEVQEKIKEELTAKPGDTNLKELDQELNAIAVALATLYKEVDAATVPLRGKLREVESWYDTVMQSCEERYTRGMKTYAFVISLAVAVWLNANIFNIYRDVSTNADMRTTIVAAGQGALQRYQEQLVAPDVINDPNKQKALNALIDHTKENIRKNTEDYGKFGFKTMEAEYAESIKGKSWPDQGRHIFMILVGWLLMAALLSLGAPFWHDALESLFGLKNLLRSQAGVRGDQAEAGSGRPHT